MIRFAEAAVTGLITAATALAIVWASTLIRGVSFIEAIRRQRCDHSLTDAPSRYAGRLDRNRPEHR